MGNQSDTPLYPLQECLDALHEIPCLAQSIGIISERVKRCKEGSKMYEELWQKYTDLNAQIAELSSKVSLTLITELKDQPQ